VFARQDAARGIALANAINDPLQRISALCEIAETLLGQDGVKQLPEGLVQRIVEPGSPVPIAQPAKDAAKPVEVVEAQPDRLRLRIPNADPTALYTLRYISNAGAFAWEDLTAAADGIVTLQDDRHLLLAQRLGCRSVAPR